jgi:cell division protein FtsL
MNPLNLGAMQGAKTVPFTKNSVSFWLAALVVALVLSVGLTSCETVEDEVKQGVEKVEEQVVTEAKKLAWSQVSDGLNGLKETLQNDQEKGVDWARSEVAKVRDRLQSVLGTTDDGSVRGLGWVDEELQKLEEKLAEYENSDQVIDAIDEFIRDLEAKLELSE